MFKPVPKQSGIYLVKDNINKLQLKVHFRTINTHLKLPIYDPYEYTNRKAVTTGEKSENSPSIDEKIIVVKWQQKLFSSTECELYNDLKNCTNQQQRKYHELLKGKDTDKKHTKKRHNSKHIKKEMDTISTKGNFIFTYVHEDNFLSSGELDNRRQIKHYNKEPFEEMFIYAALNPDTQLAVLRWFCRQRILYVYPDFTCSQETPHIIEIDNNYRQLYSYRIEDVSVKDLSPSNDLQQLLYLPETPPNWRIDDEIVKTFAMPPKKTRRCAIIFTINDLSGFEYDNIHVIYHIKLPENTILEEGLLDGTSHSSSSVSRNSSLNIHIGLTWQITVLCEEQYDPSKQLCIFFEVISIDSWERERIEGFTHYFVRLLQPFHYINKLKCIRPAETFLESIERYFIGGRRKFNYERFVCELSCGNKEDHSYFHCCYGERMKNSGQLSFSCQLFTQSNCKLLKSCLVRTCGMTLDDILTAYKEARRRLEEASSN